MEEDYRSETSCALQRQRPFFDRLGGVALGLADVLSLQIRVDFEAEADKAQYLAQQTRWQ
jgi:hypothetical protein